MRDAKCPKCGGTEIMMGIEVRDDGRSSSHPLRVVVEEPEPAKHGVIWIQGQATGELRASICANCGYTELYTDNLAELYNAFKKSR
jgi:predicted nucleic-acid-binding Zn-ribbon protein